MVMTKSEMQIMTQATRTTIFRVVVFSNCVSSAIRAESNGTPMPRDVVVPAIIPRTIKTSIIGKLIF